MPSSLGGTGDYRLCFEGYPYTKHAENLQEYYLVVTGYHLSQLILHWLGTQKSDFVERDLHHIATTYLTFGSYFFNCWECGAVIAFLHDLSDIFRHLCKLLGNLYFEGLTSTIFFSMTIAWYWTRCFVFPGMIYALWTI